MERIGGLEERRELPRSWRLASGTLACPACDLPVATGPRLAVGSAIACPWCEHAGLAREFFTVAVSPRPTRVDVIATLG